MRSEKLTWTKDDRQEAIHSLACELGKTDEEVSTFMEKLSARGIVKMLANNVFENEAGRVQWARGDKPTTLELITYLIGLPGYVTLDSSRQEVGRSFGYSTDEVDRILGELRDNEGLRLKSGKWHRVSNLD